MANGFVGFASSRKANNRHRGAAPLASLAILVVLGASAGGTARAADDSAARAVAERLVTGMGGRAAMDACPMVIFRFAVERDGKTVVDRFHAWDRNTGRYRFETKTREGEDLRVLMNVNDKTGQVWLAGRLLDDEAAAPYLERAHGGFINDTYWLMMPWKWLDPGVHLASAGTREVEGRSCDVVQLSFDSGIGLTSNDRYWGFVGPEGLMNRWEYVLQDSVGNPGTEPPTVWAWEDWADAGGGVKIAHVKRRVGGEGQVFIWHPLVQFLKTVDEAVLSPPAPPEGTPPPGNRPPPR